VFDPSEQVDLVAIRESLRKMTDRELLEYAGRVHGEPAGVVWSDAPHVPHSVRGDARGVETQEERGYLITLSPNTLNRPKVYPQRGSGRHPHIVCWNRKNWS
jgi:hypothetical protein